MLKAMLTVKGLDLDALFISHINHAWKQRQNKPYFDNGCYQALQNNLKVKSIAMKTVIFCISSTVEGAILQHTTRHKSQAAYIGGLLLSSFNI
ncbi:hypothetical protein BUALT_Bualt05G0169800 [Buddleja alternifolia]|uniref:Uncharacterized protein n=1 Tax=Buddleja alternifolia TaxID=168488 RepID=A0AAV6XWA7_9LAMI|nr:hypothetical protein BUALT_Bualt05G0169800 [Buddleja alternifolia]